MPFVTVTYDNSHVRDYNTREVGANPKHDAQDSGTGYPDGTLYVRANKNTPDRLLRNDNASGGAGSAHLTPEQVIDKWRFTFEVDENSEVVPGSEVKVEYKLVGEDTWNNFYDDTDLEEVGNSPYRVDKDGGVDNANSSNEFIALVSINEANQTDTGFMLSKRPLELGDTFILDDPTNLRSQFSVCFTKGTRIETIEGSVNVEALEPGDSVLTLSGIQKVRAVLKSSFTADQMQANHKLCPVVIRKGALGDGVPMRDLRVSRQHRMMLRSEHLQEIFGEDEALVAAAHLACLPGIQLTKNTSPVEYFHIVFDKHEVIFAEGAEAESFYPGEMAIRAMPAQAREELFLIFPELKNGNVEDIMGQAGFMPTIKQQKEIVRYVKKNL